MEKTTLRLYCKEKMTCVAIENPGVIPKAGDLIHVENVKIFDPICAEKPEFKLHVLYKISNEPANIWFDMKTKTLTVDLNTEYIDEISKSSIELIKSKRVAKEAIQSEIRKV